MGTKTISLADDAYERLKAAKREGESFSDVVRRLTQSVTIAEYHGVLEEETAEELDVLVEARRSTMTDEQRTRVDQLRDTFEQ